MQGTPQIKRPLAAHGTRFTWRATEIHPRLGASSHRAPLQPSPWQRGDGPHGRKPSRSRAPGVHRLLLRVPPDSTNRLSLEGEHLTTGDGLLAKGGERTRMRLARGGGSAVGMYDHHMASHLRHNSKTRSNLGLCTCKLMPEECRWLDRSKTSAYASSSRVQAL